MSPAALEAGPLARAAYRLDPAFTDCAGPGWEDLRPGVRMRLLFDSGAGHRVALLHYLPGASVPRHMHGGDEHIFVLRGSQRDGDGILPAGAYAFNPAGSVHAVRSPEGCLVLVHWLGPVRFLKGDPGPAGTVA